MSTSFTLLIQSLLFYCICNLTLKAKHIPTILTIGDSITEGLQNSPSYRKYLIPSLIDKGIEVKFIGPKKDSSSAHAGYSGKSTKQLTVIAKNIYTNHPADIVLIHSGHNEFNKNKPIQTIIQNTKKMIQAIVKINPNVKILLAQVITSQKLPKYAYIPHLNTEISNLVKTLKKQKINIHLVNQAQGFTPEIHTILDKVHPNKKGAQKIANKWVSALLPLLNHCAPLEVMTLRLKNDSKSTSSIIAEKKLPNGRVAEVNIPTLDVYRPRNSNGVALVFVSGGGYSRLASGPIGLGAADEFLKDGYTIFSLKYRLSPPSSNVVQDACDDAELAMKLIRKKSAEWQINPRKIGMIGYSAGANLILNLATRTKIEPKSKQAYSSQPDFMVLASLWRHLQHDISDFSLHRNLPPTMILTAKNDRLSTPKQAVEMTQALKKLGVTVQLDIYDKGGHMGFNFPNPINTEWPKRFRKWLIKANLK